MRRVLLLGGQEALADAAVAVTLKDAEVTVATLPTAKNLYYAVQPFVRAVQEHTEVLVWGPGVPTLLLADWSVFPRDVPVSFVRAAHLAELLAQDRRVLLPPDARPVLHVGPAPPADDKALSVLVVAGFDAAGQASAITKALNRHSRHTAKLLLYQTNFLHYADPDLLLFPDGKLDPAAAHTAAATADAADIVHFVQPPLDDDLCWLDHARPNNSVVQYVGTDLRQDPEKVHAWHDAGILGLAAWDWTMTEPAAAGWAPWMPYHLPMLVDTDAVRRTEERGEHPPEPLRVCHPTTNRTFKQTDLFLRTAESIPGIEPVVIEGEAHAECLRIKRSCSITFDQLSTGIYGVSAVESMAMGHVVLGRLSAWARTFYPDAPLVPVTQDTLRTTLERLVADPDAFAVERAAGPAWAERNHGLRLGAVRLDALYRFIRGGNQ